VLPSGSISRFLCAPGATGGSSGDGCGGGARLVLAMKRKADQKGENSQHEGNEQGSKKGKKNPF